MNIKTPVRSILFSQCLFFLFSGMDSNSQTSQELLIPNDVSIFKLLIYLFFFMLLVFSLLNKIKLKIKQEIRAHLMYTAQEQVISDVVAATARRLV